MMNDVRRRMHQDAPKTGRSEGPKNKAMRDRPLPTTKFKQTKRRCLNTLVLCTICCLFVLFRQLAKYAPSEIQPMKKISRIDISTRSQDSAKLSRGQNEQHSQNMNETKQVSLPLHAVQSPCDNETYNHIVSKPLALPNVLLIEAGTSAVSTRLDKCQMNHRSWNCIPLLTQVLLIYINGEAFQLVVRKQCVSP